ncbi:17363_t:CDS:2, partial [Dentiscutata erythropus]
MSSLPAQSKGPVPNHNNDLVPKCIHEEFSCSSGGSTSSLWCHLESAHWTQYITTEEYHKKKKKVQGVNIMEAFRKDSKNSPAPVLTNADNMKLRDMFTAWIIKRQRPFTIVEDPEFVEIIQYLNPTAQ